MRSAVPQILRAAAMIAVMVLVDYGFAQVNAPYRPHVSSALVVAALITKCGLASVWAAIGRDNFLLRLVVFLIAFLGNWQFLRQWDVRAESEMILAFWVEAVTIIGVLTLMRVVRFTTTRSSIATLSTLSVGREVPRFSVRDIMLLTVLVAVALGVVTRMQSLSVRQDTQIVACVIGAMHAGVSLSAVVSALVLRRWILPSIMLIAGSLLLGWGVSIALRYDMAAALISISVPAAVQVVVLTAARIAGYRFLRGAAAVADQGGIAA